MAMFGLFGDEKAKKRKKYEKKLETTLAQLRATNDQIAKVKHALGKLEYTIKVKLAEYDSASGVMKKQLGFELQNLKRSLDATRNRFSALNTNVGTLETVRIKIEEWLANDDMPLPEDIDILIDDLGRQHIQIGIAEGAAEDLWNTNYGEEKEAPTEDFIDDMREVVGQPTRKQAEAAWNDMDMAEADRLAADLRRKVAQTE